MLWEIKPGEEEGGEIFARQIRRLLNVAEEN